MDISDKLQNKGGRKEYHFKPFHETYRWTATTLTLGLLFPNPAKDKARFMCIVCLLVIYIPLMSMFFIDIYRCWNERDMFNIIRHSTIIGPFLGAFCKMLLSCYKRVQTKQIIKEISSDYETYNHLAEHHQEVAHTSIQTNVLYTEKLWITAVGIAVGTFPVMAVVSTIYSQIFDDIPKKYMAHDLNGPFSDPDARFESPYFEVMFVYMVSVALICIINFGAYDALFSLAINHACLKLSMACLKLEEAFKQDNADKMYEGVVKFIQEQNKMFEYVDLIQDTFNVWLGTILLSTMIQIGSLLFHINAGYGFDLRYAMFSFIAVVHIFLPCKNAAKLKTMGYGFDLRYTLFSFIAVVHIFLPCKNAAKLKTMSVETATLVYCCGWERAASGRVRRVVPFLIARAQVPIRLNGFYIFEYDMDLFVNLLRTSYSMFTLLQS